MQALESSCAAVVLQASSTVAAAAAADAGSCYCYDGYRSLQNGRDSTFVGLLSSGHHCCDSTIHACLLHSDPFVCLGLDVGANVDSCFYSGCDIGHSLQSEIEIEIDFVYDDALCGCDSGFAVGLVLSC
jgi:hypothetical protein